MDMLNYIQDIGGVLGVPATVFLTILWTKVKANETTIQELKSESALLKQTLSDIRSDLSFLKGVFSKEEKDSVQH